MQPLAIRAYTLTTAAGTGRVAALRALVGRRTGLTPYRDPHGLETFAGEVRGLDDAAVIPSLAAYDCRNHRLAQFALDQDDFAAAVGEAARRYGPERIAVLAATTTSGIRETERAYERREPDGALPADFRFDTVHSLSALGDFVAHYLGVEGPRYTLSTACSSSAKVFASAARLIAAGIVDAAVVGGVDSLCRNTLYGFNALELVSKSPCRPCDRDRDGISIGEGAAFALLERANAAPAGLRLAGYGESSDAHHMSAPHPEGRGATAAMKAALAVAGLAPADIGYVNLHGTASVVNDRIEDRAVHGLFGSSTPCSSTK
ncbi:MAG TPA: beta-ketoacyl-ACP synthase, partial [Gammaproteobacteria bacterium]|nr:beta-ketoacyl-ACP synthase [Gammaproteobacteria bacterium]